MYKFAVILFMLLNFNTLSYAIEPVNCHNIACIRAHIDAINSQLLDLIALRTEYVKQAAYIKGRNHSANDTKRVQLELKNIAKLSQQKDLSASISLATFQALIQSSIQYEQQIIDKLNLPPKN